MGPGEVDADTAILPADVLSKQALEGQAEDLALEDTLYSLDKALQNNSLTPELYIKQVCPPPLFISFMSSSPAKSSACMTSDRV